MSLTEFANNIFSVILLIPVAGKENTSVPFINKEIILNLNIINKVPSSLIQIL